MHGRADVLAALGRRAEAAETLDRLASILERDGRLADACDVARSALELAESRGRRRQVESLVARLRTAAPEDAAAADALQRALGILDSGPGVAPRAARTGSDGEDRCQRRPAGVPPPPDPALLTLAVEEALEAGDLDEARRRALVAAIGHREVGQFHAAMDACYQALAILPSDPDIHLLLAELYLDRGWRGPAADKLVLLGRLSQLTGDGGDPGTAVLPRRGPIPRRPAAGGGLRLTTLSRSRVDASPSVLPGSERERCYTRGRCRLSSRRSSIRST